MESVVFEQKVLNLLQSLQKDINEVKHEVEYIKKQVSEEYLTVEEEKLLEDTLRYEKEGKLLTAEEVFGD
jgi:predicted secreted protein